MLLGIAVLTLFQIWRVWYGFSFWRRTNPALDALRGTPSATHLEREAARRQAQQASRDSQIPYKYHIKTIDIHYHSLESAKLELVNFIHFFTAMFTFLAHGCTGIVLHIRHKSIENLEARRL
jgi:hypothetical protein